MCPQINLNTVYLAKALTVVGFFCQYILKPYSYHCQIIADLGLSANFANIATANTTDVGVSFMIQMTTGYSKTTLGCNDVRSLHSANTESIGCQ